MNNLIYLLFLACVFCGVQSQHSLENVTVRGFYYHQQQFEFYVDQNTDFLQSLTTKGNFNGLEIVNQNVWVIYRRTFYNIPSLEELILENDGITRLEEEAFLDLDKLQRLSLSHNRLEIIPSGVFQVSSLRVLDLSYNLITTIHETAFGELLNLVTLNLAHNRISHWNSDWFFMTTAIRWIHVSNNSLQFIPGDALSGSFNYPINLYLSHNRIDRIENSAFEGVSQFGDLWLDNNRLETFNTEILRGKRVGDLRMNNNLLLRFDGAMEDVLNADQVEIDQNPFECNYLFNLRGWAVRNNRRISLGCAMRNCPPY